MGRTIAADVLDSRQNDWTISDDGINRGPIRTWPAPKLPASDRSPELGAKSTLTRSGLPDAYAFLRQRPIRAKLTLEDFGDEEGPEVPTSDASGLPSYRVVPRPLSSFAYDVPGFDKYEAGLLAQFMARTDAGALDGWAGCSGLECQGILSVVHDAGMPSGWYDFFSQKEGEIIGLLRQWGGSKFTPFHEKTVKDGFIGIRSHATDGSKWDYFNKAKPQTFAILQSVKGGPKYVWNQPSTNEQRALQKIWSDLENHVNSQGKGFIASIGSAIGGVGKGVVSIAKGIATPVAGLVASPFKLASDIASGKNVFQSLKDTVKRDLANVKDVAPYVQAAISVIPGVGAGVNAAIAAGAALANGQPITSALVAGLKNALPGGPIAAQAFDTAYAIARGQNIGEAALQALVNQVPGGAIGKQAAQAAIAIAKGQNIQQAALTAVKGIAADKLGAIIPKDTPELLKTAITDLSQGKSLVDTAKDAVGSTAMASFAKLSPVAVGVMNQAGPLIGGALQGGLPSILPTEVKMVASSLLATPALRNLPVEDLARKLNVSTHAVRDGMGAVLQAVQNSGGPSVPSLSYAKTLAARIPAGMSFDRAMPAFASKVAPKVWSHNVASPAAAAARLRRAGGVFAALSARGLDCGALDPKSMPTLRQGSTGEPVKQWQKILGITADGQFGPNTTAATKAFQSKNGLVADGIVGLKSWTAGLLQVVTTAPTQTVPGTTIPINVPPPTTTAPIIAGQMPIIKKGSTGPAVKTWQTFLTITADGIFGVNTESATKAFQAKNGLVADGIVGPKTWEKAMSGTSAPTTGPSSPPSLPPQLPIPIPGLPPISLPPGLPPMPPLPPDFPPIVYPPVGTNPPGQPPPPSLPPLPPGQPPMPPPPTAPPTIPPDWQPPIGGTRPPPVYVPPGGGGSTGGNALLIGGAVVLGAILLLGSGSQRNLT